MTQLWSDEKIDGLSVAFMKDDLASKWIHKTIATDMRNDYERALSFRNETIGNLQGELRDMQARIAELEAQLQALGVVVDAQNRQLKAIALTQMVQAHGDENNNWPQDLTQMGKQT